MNSNVEWKSYTRNEHNYIFFQLNNIHNERDYFDSMYEFWLKYFQRESNGGECHIELLKIKMTKHLVPFLIILSVLLIILMLYFLCKCYHRRERYRTPNDLLQYPSFVTT